MKPAVFGEKPAGSALIRRRGAYALILEDGRFGAVEERGGVFFLPGGGLKAGESPEQALKRELLEELGAGIDSLAPAGQALQYFASGGREYALLASFFRVKLGAVGTQESEYELHWLPHHHANRLFHECQRWAVRRLAGAPAA